MPFGGTTEAHFQHLSRGGRESRKILLNLSDTLGGAVKSRLELLLQKHSDKRPQLQLSRKSGHPLALALLGHDGLQFDKASQPLTCCSGADAEILDDFLHGKGLAGCKEKSVDRSDGRGVTKEFGKVGKNIRHLALDLLGRVLIPL